MKRLFLILFIFTGSFVASCQCSEKPTVPPVNEEAQTDAFDRA